MVSLLVAVLAALHVPTSFLVPAVVGVRPKQLNFNQASARSIAMTPRSSFVALSPKLAPADGAKDDAPGGGQTQDATAKVTKDMDGQKAGDGNTQMEATQDEDEASSAVAKVEAKVDHAVEDVEKAEADIGAVKPQWVGDVRCGHECYGFGDAPANKTGRRMFRYAFWKDGIGQHRDDKGVLLKCECDLYHVQCKEHCDINTVCSKRECDPLAGVGACKEKPPVCQACTDCNAAARRSELRTVVIIASCPLAIAIPFCLIFAFMYKSKVVDKIPGMSEKPLDMSTNFKSGLFGCFGDCQICLHTICCASCRMGQTMQVAGVMAFWPVLMIMFMCSWFCTPLYLIVGSYANLSVLCIVLFQCVGFPCFSAYLRSQLRQKLGYQPEFFVDFFKYCCLWPCTVGEDAMEVDVESDVKVLCCCNLLSFKQSQGEAVGAAVTVQPVAASQPVVAGGASEPVAA